MERTLSRNWWAFALRGALAMVFALLVVAWSDATPVSLARIFAVFAIGEGALAIGSSLGASSLGAGGADDRPWPLLFEGTIGIGFGLVALIAPFHSLATVAWVVASWIAMVGLLEGATALKFRRHLATPRLLIGLAVVSVIAAAAMVFSPRAGEIVTVWLLGSWSAFLGVVTFMIGMVLRRDHIAELSPYESRTSVPSLIPVRPSRPSLRRRFIPRGFDDRS
jgi:uncharacterized membrane protein HdeD (DUF308 family)